MLGQDTVVVLEQIDQVGIVVGFVLDRRWEMVLGESSVVADTDTDNCLLSQVVHPLDQILDWTVVVQILSPSLPLPFHLFHLVPRGHSHQTLHSHSYSAAA